MIGCISRLQSAQFSVLCLSPSNGLSLVLPVYGVLLALLSVTDSQLVYLQAQRLSRTCCLAAARSARAAAAAAAAAAADSDDDDILMEREVDLDTVLARRRQDAICNGQMIDLAADVDDQQLQRCTVCLCRDMI